MKLDIVLAKRSFTNMIKQNVAESEIGVQAKLMILKTFARLTKVSTKCSLGMSTGSRTARMPEKEVTANQCIIVNLYTLQSY